MSLAAKLFPTPPRSPLRLPAELAGQLEAFARGLGPRGAEVVALGLQLLDKQLEAAPELVRSRVLVLQAQRLDASDPKVAGRLGPGVTRRRRPRASPP
jgi:hypothetical protein